MARLLSRAAAGAAQGAGSFGFREDFYITGDCMKGVYSATISYVMGCYNKFSIPFLHSDLYNKVPATTRLPHIPEKIYVLHPAPEVLNVFGCSLPQ